MDKSWMHEPRSSSSGTASKKGNTSRASNSMADILHEQEEIIGLSPYQSPFVPQLTKKCKVSWPSGSMVEILGELDETASSPCQTPLAPQLNHDGSASKKKRGPTRCLKTHGLRYEDRLPIRLNVLGQPIGRYRASLSNYLGTLARNAHLTPLTYTSWKGLKENWEDMWKTVTSKFDIEERAKKWVLQTICSSWRTHKCRLKKKYFKANMTEAYNLKNRPSVVPLEQWKILIKFWKSELAKERSMKNRISRAKHISMHTTGSKTFAEIREEEAMKNPDGREPSRVEMYFITHKPKNGKPMNEGTSRIVAELEKAIALHPEASEHNTARDDIFSQVLGKDRPGHVRTYGKGVVPSDLWGTRSQLETQKLIEEVKRNAQVEIQSIHQKMQEEMEVKLQKQVEVVKTEMLSGFNMVLTQLQKCFPGVVIPDLSSMSVENINEEATIARSSATTHHVAKEQTTKETVVTTVEKAFETNFQNCSKELHFQRSKREHIEDESHHLGKSLKSNNPDDGAKQKLNLKLYKLKKSRKKDIQVLRKKDIQYSIPNTNEGEAIDACSLEQTAKETTAIAAKKAFVVNFQNCSESQEITDMIKDFDGSGAAIRGKKGSGGHKHMSGV